MNKGCTSSTVERSKLVGRQFPPISRPRGENTLKFETRASTPGVIVSKSSTKTKFTYRSLFIIQGSGTVNKVLPAN